MKLEVQSEQEGQRYSSALEVGDFVPYFCIENSDRKLDIQVKAGRHNLLLFAPSRQPGLLSDCLAFDSEYQSFVITDASTQLSNGNLFFDPDVFRLFADQSNTAITACICDRNLKIGFIATVANIAELYDTLPTISELPLSGAPPPVLLVPNVISDSLARRLIEYHEGNAEQLFRNQTEFKSRNHIHPPKELQIELDDKISKSLLPEIEKVYFSKISHRETYKICCYAADDEGHFGKHRDTIEPYLHRRYAMTLVLNDEFEGGGISFPEYSDEIMTVPKNWAVIFPGSLYHQVNTIGVGRRYVLISFLFSENEARKKDDSERYRFQVERDVCGIKINRLVPISE